MKDNDIFELYDETDEFHALLIGTFRTFKELQEYAAEYKSGHPDCVQRAYKLTRVEQYLSPSFWKRAERN